MRDKEGPSIIWNESGQVQERGALPLLLGRPWNDGKRHAGILGPKAAPPVLTSWGSTSAALEGLIVIST